MNKVLPSSPSIQTDAEPNGAPFALLTELRQRKVHLWVEGDRLRFRAPEGIMTPHLLDQLRLHKSDIIAFLAKAAAQRTETTAIPTVDRTRPLLLTYAQERLWFQEQIHDSSQAAYHMSATLHLRGPLDLAALEASFNALIARHEILRTTFPLYDEQPVQQIAPQAKVVLRVVKLASSPPLPDGSDPWRALINAEATEPFDLTCGPLLRVLVVRLRESPADPAQAEHLLTVTMHHMVSDGWSIQLLIHEVASIYAAVTQGQPPHLAELPVQYADYAHWQREQLQGESLQNALAYWETKLAGAPPLLELPTDYARQPVQQVTGARFRQQLDGALLAELRRISQQHEATLFMTLVTAFTVLLARYSGHNDVVIGTPIANRNHHSIETLIGFFVNTLLLRTNIEGNPTFGELLGQVRQTALEAYAHQALPYIKLVEHLQPVRNLSYNPLYQVMFALDDGSTPFPTLVGVNVTPVETDLVAAEDDLFLQVNLNAHGFELNWEYNAELFKTATIERLSTHFGQMLHAIVAHPATPILQLPLLTGAERQQLLVNWNETEVTFEAAQGYHQLFERQVAETPDAVAVLYEGCTLTYGELNAQAEHLAAHLRAYGIGSHEDETRNLVALLCDRSPLFLAAVIALFKAGGAYLPLDVRAPASRQAQVLGQSQTPLLLITADFADLAAAAVAELPEVERPLVLDLHALVLEASAAPHTAQYGAEEIEYGSRLAYVIYTSGSTGLPKGAMVEQRGMNNHIYAKIGDLGLTAADTVAQTAPQSFDIAVWQFLCPLLVGGRVCIFPDEVAADPAALLRQTAAEGITVLEVVPSLLRMMVDELASGLPVQLHKLRWMIPTGEALPPHLARQWLHHCPQIPLVNAYGPTECSDDVTHYFVTEPPAASVVNMPIGRPLMNMRMYILDAYGQPVPIGVAGELYVGGVGVGRGYIHDAERTAQAFVPDPFSQEPQARLYKTGDKARYLPDGNIEYLGRLDYQVKIRGFRIELGEIEATLEQHPGVYQAIVMDQPDATGNKRLVAYIAPNAQVASADYAAPDDEAGVQPLTTSALRAFLGAKLPDYMVPSMFVILEQMPLTPNGKVDRKALPAPADAIWGVENEYVAPHNDLQAQLVAIWANVLKLEPECIGVQHNFFELGGHSLLGVQIIARVRAAFQVEIPIRTLMENPTIAGMADEIQRQPMMPPVAPTMLAAEQADNTREVIEL